MYGILFTMHSSMEATAIIHHIEGIPTEALAKKIADDWVKQIDKYKAHRHTLVYEMEQPKQAEPPLFTYSTGPAGATLNLTPQQLLDKVDTLCTKLDTLKRFICDDPTVTSLLVEEVTLAHHLAHELWDALPDAESDDGAIGEAIKKAYGDETKNG